MSFRFPVQEHIIWSRKSKCSGPVTSNTRSKPLSTVALPQEVSLSLMGLRDNAICRRCGNEEQTSVHVLCECEALASLRHSYQVSFFLDPKDIRKLNIGAIWKFPKGAGFL